VNPLDLLHIYLTRAREDERDLRALAARCPAIDFRTVSPELVQVRFQVAGLHRLPDGEIVTAREHFAEIFRPPTYPVAAGPLVRMTTQDVQHWHPNICPLSGMVCYGVLEPERWAPSLGLDDVLRIVARMLRLEIFNLGDVIETARDGALYVRRLAEEGRTPLDDQPLASGVDDLSDSDAPVLDIDLEEEGT
jgi:ubiquitin-protein ligase